MKRPAHQIIIIGIAATLAGYILLGTLLDSISNAIAILTPRLALIGTIALAFTWTIAQFVLPRFPIPWVYGGQQSNIKRLGFKTTCAFIGFILLLWTPTTIDSFKSKEIIQPIPAPRKWLELTEEERKQFIATLKSQSTQREQIKLGCAAMSEDVCVSSSKFIDLFKRGGWIIQNDKIERVIPGKPTAGVAIFKYGHADAFDPADPDQGKWVEQTASLETVRQAFASIGIETVALADETMPKNVIGVFFGIEPKK